jgi:hypothetical protein
MMKLNRIATYGAIIMLLGLSGCVVGGGGHPYGDNRGDDRSVDQHRDDRAGDQQHGDEHRCDGPEGENCSR